MNYQIVSVCYNLTSEGAAEFINRFSEAVSNEGVDFLKKLSTYIWIIFLIGKDIAKMIISLLKYNISFRQGHNIERKIAFRLIWSYNTPFF